MRTVAITASAEIAVAIENGGRPTLSLFPFAIGNHPFGQDEIGRDIFAVVMRGTQQSLMIMVIVGAIATFIGTVIGAISGYYRGWTDSVLMRFTDIIITIPVMKHAVNVDLPRATNQPENVKPETVRLSVSADGKFFWNESQVSEEELFPRLQAEAAKEPQPDLHIRGDKNVRYEFVAQAMAAAQRAGVRKIGFVTDPQGQ